MIVPRETKSTHISLYFKSISMNDLFILTNKQVTEKQTGLPSVGSLLKRLPYPGLGQAGADKFGIFSDLWTRMQGSNSFGHLLLLSQLRSGSEADQAGFKALLWWQHQKLWFDLLHQIPVPLLFKKTKQKPEKHQIAWSFLILIKNLNKDVIYSFCIFDLSVINLYILGSILEVSGHT